VVSCGGDTLTPGPTSSGTGTTTPSSNVASVTVSAGPVGVNAVNALYTSVTVCVPGTTTCQTIDNIQVDTGSYGLRLLAPVVTLTLPVAQATGGGGLVECTEFVDGYSWGPVALVDLQIAGESASSVPVQLIGDSRYPTAPAGCSGPAPASENTVAQFGANGVLGIGPFAQDCGDTCVNGFPPILLYYACTSSTACQGTVVPLSAQVVNPVTMFSTDNNGTIITLPTVASAGAANVAGSLIFGIDTESNNASGTETVVPVSDAGFVTTVFNGETLAESFVDSGSNGTYFNDSSINQCSTQSGSSSSFTTFYCPTSPLTLTASFELADNSTVNASFEVASADTVSVTDTAYPGLAGTIPALPGAQSMTNTSFDWGLPFFYGRRVVNAIAGAATSAGAGPYIAY
jgi:hypothetical protein